MAYFKLNTVQENLLIDMMIRTTAVSNHPHNHTRCPLLPKNNGFDAEGDFADTHVSNRDAMVICYGCFLVESPVKKALH